MSATTTTQAFIGKGSIYLEEIGGNMGLLPFGNRPELTLAFAEDKKEMKDSEDAGGGVVASVSRIASVTGSISALSISKENIALALRGLGHPEKAEKILTKLKEEGLRLIDGHFKDYVRKNEIFLEALGYLYFSKVCKANEEMQKARENLNKAESLFSMIEREAMIYAQIAYASARQ